MTNRDQLDGMLSTLGDLTSLSQRWDTFLGETQNPLPDGGADGTIDADTWRHMRDLCTAIHAAMRAQAALNRGVLAAFALAKLTPAERDALGLT